MPDRHDALCAAAELMLALEELARSSGSLDTVATTGTCVVHPGAVNSVPSRVLLEADVRDTDAARRDELMRVLERRSAEIGKRRGVRILRETINADQPARSDPALVTLLDEICASREVRSRHMVSRAYHDSLFLARIAPMVMLFVPCRGGISHHPAEFCAPVQYALGAGVLAEALRRLASR